MKIEIKSGDVFWKWTVTKVFGSKALCKCECGTERILIVKFLISGLTKQCRDCWSKRGGGLRKKHLREYNSWHYMKDRCLREKSSCYHRYGGRGIKIHEPWINSFEQFLKDMGPAPEYDDDVPSLERIDNDGNYEPSNCKWVGMFKDQPKNRRSNKLTKEQVSIIRKSSVDTALLASKFKVSKAHIRKIRSGKHWN